MQTLPRRLGVAVIVAVIVAFLSIKLDTFRDYQIAEIAVEVTAVAGLTLLTGLSGQISLGHGAFMAIGGYTAALLLMHLNWPFEVVLVLAAVVHGYPWLIHRLTYRRTNHPNIHVRGYKEEGTTTTPFDMVMLNDLDRFHLVIDVIDRVPGLVERASHLRQHMIDERLRHRAYTREHGDDPAELRNWTWPAERGVPGAQVESGAPGDGA